MDKEVRPKKAKSLEDMWPKVRLPFYGEVALGNGTRFTIGMMEVECGGEKNIFIGVEGKGAYLFKKFAHWTYVVEKLQLLSGDAKQVADFINVQTGVNNIAQGNYDDEECVLGEKEYCKYDLEWMKRRAENI